MSFRRKASQLEYNEKSGFEGKRGKPPPRSSPARTGFPLPPLRDPAPQRPASQTAFI